MIVFAFRRVVCCCSGDLDMDRREEIKIKNTHFALLRSSILCKASEVVR